MLTTTGARSGRPRTTPVLGLPAIDGIAVAAANFGRPDHPSWYYNLRANPSATLAVAGLPRQVTAVEADGAERERILREGLRIYPGWTQYERRAADRRIAIFRLRRATTPEDGPRAAPS
jgi:deazaflavin-dependent oxidoreductase (nitroreductase family)